jgi:septal ring factor EnvC (AmiA/AmiB activator)
MATRTARRTNGNGNLEGAMAMLMQNQAVLMQNQAQFLAQLSESRQEIAESRKTFARIEKDLDTIKAVLVRHETLLEKLADAIREKIGFKAT